MSQISPKLDALSVRVLDTALDILAETGDMPVLVGVNDDEEFTSFEDDTPDGCYRAARDHVRSLGKKCKRYVICYTGIVQEDPKKKGEPAVFFEFGERGMDHAWSGYMLYRLVNGDVETTDPQPAGAEELLLR